MAKAGRATATTSIEPGFLRPAQAAKYLSVSPRTVRDWQARRAIPYIAMGRKCILFRRADLDKALARFAVKAAGD